jgi:TRAP transporter TAXI family solute receptor
MKGARKFSHVVMVLLLLGILTSAAYAQKLKIQPIQVTVAAGSTGGSWFIISTAFFSLFSDNIEGLSYSIIPGGGVANPITINRKDAMFGMGYTTNLWAAYNGHEPYKAKLTDIRGIANINVSSVIHAWMLKSVGINTIKEIAQKKFPLKLDSGPRGTGGELAAARCLELHGASYQNIKSWGGAITHSPYTEAIDRLKDGHIQCFINDDIIGVPVYVELSSARDVVLLPQDPDVVKEMNRKYGYTPKVIPAHSYKGQDKDVLSTAQSHVFFCHKDVPENLVYTMTKLIFTNKQRLIGVHKLFTSLDPSVGPKDFPIPLHPGAERYYKEIGVLK